VRGQDERGGLLLRGLEVPVQLRQVVPDDPAARHVVAEPEDRVGGPFDGEHRAERGDCGARGIGAPGVVQLDRKERLERGAFVGERVEVLARDEHQAAALLGDELDEVLHLRRVQEGGVGVAQDDHVVGEQAVGPVLQRRELGERVGVLLGVFGVAGEEHDLQVDRLISLQEALEVAELVAGFPLDDQHLELVLADVDVRVMTLLSALSSRGSGSTSRM